MDALLGLVGTIVCLFGGFVILIYLMNKVDR